MLRNQLTYSISIYINLILNININVSILYGLGQNGQTGTLTIFGDAT